MSGRIRRRAEAKGRSSGKNVSRTVRASHRVIATMYTEVRKCRICGSPELCPVLDLGEQSLTGVFPASPEKKVTRGPLELVKCSGSDGSCGLLQLRHSYSLEEMYGQSYGYRSGLNRSMVDHLHAVARRLCRIARPVPGDLILDIGSNDGTLLQGYPDTGLLLAGIDPTGKKFERYYPGRIALIPGFFSADGIRARFGSRKAKIITSIAMFYDLEAPLEFMTQVLEILADDGVWCLEQSYMPAMLDANAYDTICHERLEYYGLSQIKWMADRSGFKIIDVELNAVNGGSFSVILARKSSGHPEASGRIASLLQREEQRCLNTASPYLLFQERILRHREELRDFMDKARTDGKKVLGYGASTKGNVILQFCGISSRDLPCIAEVNRDKFGSFTPGTLIPIVSEEDARSRKPDYFMVLPWHFRDHIIARETRYLRSGGRLFFPLPRLQAVGRQ